MKPKALTPGDRVTVVGQHPWSGHSGVIEERMKQNLWRVRLDIGIAAGVRDDQMAYQEGTDDV